MAWSNPLFTSADLSAGGVGSDAGAYLHVGGTAQVTLDGLAVSLGLGGTVSLKARIDGSMPTHDVTIGWGHFQSTETVPDLSGRPGISGSVTVVASVTVATDDVARTLFAGADPASATTFPVRLASLCGDAVSGWLDDGYDQLFANFSTDSFPFWSQLPGDLRDSVNQQIDSLRSGGRDDLGKRFTSSVVAELARLKPALIQLARDVLSGAQGDAARALRWLAALGEDVGAAMADLRGKLADLVAQGKAFLELCLALLDAGGSDAAEVLAEVVYGARDAWSSRKAAVQQLVDGIGQRLASGAAAARTFALHAADVVARRLGDQLAAASAAVFDVLAMLRGLASLGWADFGALVGAVLSRLEQIGQDLGGLCQHLFAAIRVSRDELFELLKHLGPDALVKKVARWMIDHFEQVAAALRDGTAAEVKRILDYLCGVVDKLPPPPLPPGLLQLVHLLDWLHQHHGTLLVDPAQALLDDYRAARRVLLEHRLTASLHFQARQNNTNVVAVVKGLLDRGSGTTRFLGRIHDALHQLGGTASDRTHEGYARWLRAVADLYDIERALDAMVFGGGLPGDTPAWATASIRGFFTKPIVAPAGVQITSQPPSVTDVMSGAGDAWVGLASQVSPDIATLDLAGGLGRLAVPGPADTSAIDFSTGAASAHASFPYGLNQWTTSKAIAHLPEFWILDMRYEMPYGDVGSYRVADLDGDGFVRDWEVAQVRAAATAGPSAKYDPKLDCNGDGRIDAEDVQLASEQRTRYIDGRMWRPVTGPVGLWTSPAPGQWAFVLPFASASIESIPGKIERVGGLAAMELQLMLPIVNYPLRAHVEVRDVLDSFPGDLAIGGAPLVGLPSFRYDAVLRGGDGGRDFQASAWVQAPNPLLRTFNLKATFFLKGLLSFFSDFGLLAGLASETIAGIAGKGDIKVFVHYETSEPLIVVLEEWHDRLKDLFTTRFQDLVPFDLLRAVIEWTNLPRLFRTMLAIAGPISDLLFAWIDHQHLRGVMAHLREVTLAGYLPTPTFGQVLAEIGSWSDLPGDVRAVVVAAVREELADCATLPDETGDLVAVAEHRAPAAHARVPVGDDTPFFTPSRCYARLKPRLATFQPAAATPPRDLRGAPGHLVAATPGDSVEAVEEIQQQQLVAAALGKVAAYLGKRQRFVAGLEQLVPDLQPAEVDIPVCGRFQVVKPSVLSSVSSDSRAPARPIYHALVRFGTDVTLYAAPFVAHHLEVCQPSPLSMGSVEGARALLAADGAMWLFVRTADFQYGWLRLPASAVERIYHEVEVLGIPLQVIVPDLLATLQDTAADAHLMQSTGVTRIQMAPGDTTGDNDELGIAVQAMAGAAGKEAERIRELHARALWELKVRMYGPAHASKSDDELRAAWIKLDFDKRATLWSQLSAWMQCSHLAMALGERLLADVGPPLLQHHIKDAWEALLRILKGTKDHFEVGDAVEVALQVAPRIVELVKLIIQIVGRIIKLVRAAKHKDLGVLGDLDISGSLSRPRSADQTWKTMGLDLVRLLVDDEAKPGDEDPKDDPAPGHRPSHDHAIAFSVKSEGFATDDDANQAGQKDKAEQDQADAGFLALLKRRVGLLADSVVKAYAQSRALIDSTIQAAKDDVDQVAHAFLSDLPDELYRDIVGPSAYDATCAMPWSQRRDYFLRLAYRNVNRDISWHLDPLSDDLDKESAYRIAVTNEVYLATRDLDWPAREEHYHALVGDDYYQATRTLSWSQRAAYARAACERQMVQDDLTWDAIRDLTPAQRSEYHATAMWRATVGAQGWDETRDMSWDERKAWAQARSKKDYQAWGVKPRKVQKPKEVDLALDFGADKITIKISIESGAGAGAGDSAGSGADAAPTGNIEWHFAGPTFSVADLLTSRDAVTIMVRFALRFFHHLLDAVNLAIEYAREPHPTGWEGAEQFFDTAWWCGVFSLFAMGDAMADIAADHAGWLATFLGSIEWKFTIEANVSASADAWAHVDLREKVNGEAKVPLAVLLAPIIEFLCAASPRRTVGKGFAERVIPRLAFQVSDVTGAKVGAFPVCFEVESAGKLAGGEIAIPQGSPLRAQLEALGDAVGKACEHYKQGRLQSVRDEVKALRTFLDLLDQGLKNTLKEDPLGAVYDTASPLVALIVDSLLGHSSDATPPKPASDKAQQLVAALAQSGVVGMATRPGPVLLVTTDDKGSTLTLWMDEGEKARFDGAGFSPVSATARLENATFRVPVDGDPVGMLWSTYRDPLSLTSGVVQGIAAAFDTGDAARAFAHRRHTFYPDWTPGTPEDAVWAHDDRWLAWLETELVGKLTAAACPLPELAFEDGHLVLRFPFTPLDAAENAGAKVLAAASSSERRKVYEVVLLSGASAAETDLVRNQLASNAQAAPRA